MSKPEASSGTKTDSPADTSKKKNDTSSGIYTVYDRLGEIGIRTIEEFAARVGCTEDPEHPGEYRVDSKHVEELLDMLVGVDQNKDAWLHWLRTIAIEGMEMLRGRPRARITAASSRAIIQTLFKETRDVDR